MTKTLVRWAIALSVMACLQWLGILAPVVGIFFLVSGAIYLFMRYAPHSDNEREMQSSDATVDLMYRNDEHKMWQVHQNVPRG